MIDKTNLRIETVNEYCIVDEKNQIIKDGFCSEEEAAKWLEDAYGIKHEPKPQPKIGGWIPCSDRLPDKGVMNPITNDYAEYLCTVCVDGFRTVRPIKFDKDGCWVNHGMNFDKYVTAWQPLPEAYHG